MHKRIQSTFLFRVILKEQEAKHQLSNGAALALHFVLSFVVEFIIEAFSRHSVASALAFMDNSTQVFFYNSMMIFIWSLAAFLFRKRRLVSFVVFVTWLILDYCLNHQILSSYFSNIAFAYQDYGFPYCFTVTITDTGVDEPNNYSQLTIHSIVNKATDKVGKSTLDLDKKPNIIFVQLESFFDPSRVNYF